MLISNISFAAPVMPADLLASAVIDDIVYDPDFDYIKLGRSSRLSLFTNSYNQAKHLIDEVIVIKSHHKMFLMKNKHIIRSYWIALSDRPQGDKQFEGDRRTPEGTYTLDYVKSRSNYYKAFHISYPNPDDIANARRYGRNPGGMIMVHGQPGGSGDETIQRSDWTNGCIALMNPEIDEFIAMVDPGTPITIKP